LLAITFLACAQKKSIKEPGDMPIPKGIKTETATFAGGCFWCTEAQFQYLDGVLKVKSGYSGGTVANPSYAEVCTGTTGHAEAIQVTYDPSKITYVELLEAFWQSHDPTQLNRQGPDEGPQYRSAIFPGSDEQAAIAKAYITQLMDAGLFGAPIVTTLEPGKAFFRAEDHHQDFLERNPSNSYIAAHDLPKLAQFKRLFPELYRARPILVGVE